MPKKHGQLPSAAAQVADRKPRKERPTTVRRTSLYLAESIYQALRTVAFKERCKMHDVVIEGIGLALRNRGYPPVDELKLGKR